MLGQQYSSRLPSAPSYGFGTSERTQLSEKIYISRDMVVDKLGKASPGPKYRPTAFDGRVPTAPSPSMGTSARYPVVGQAGRGDGDPVPGPGQYSVHGALSPQHVSQRESASSWKFGTSTRDDQAKVYVSAAHAKVQPVFVDSPGPATYGSAGGLGEQPDSRKSSNHGFGMGTSARFFYDEHGARARALPGPGQYTLRSGQGRQVTSTKPSLPMAAFSRADRDKTALSVYMGRRQEQAFWGRNSPGPAVYSPQQAVGYQALSVKPNLPKFGFGTASRFGYIDVANRAMQSPGPGSYSI